jgi:hypothetical protein
VELGEALGHGRLCLEAEQISQQVVVAEPRPGAIEGDEELVRPSGRAQPLGVAAVVGDGVDEIAGELVEDRGLQKASVVVRFEAREQLVAEVLDDEVVVAPESGDEGFGVASVLEGETGEDEARSPALGAVAQVGEQIRVEGVVGATEQAGRLLGTEPTTRAGWARPA